MVVRSGWIPHIYLEGMAGKNWLNVLVWDVSEEKKLGWLMFPG